MSIKSLAHLAHQRIATSSGASFKRAHFYELTAAAFGYNSFAAFGAESVLFTGTPATVTNVANPSAVRKRCSDLGYTDEHSEAISNGICAALAEHRIDAIRIERLVRILRERNHNDVLDSDDESTPFSHALHADDFELPSESELSDWILLESLLSAGRRDSALAHYAIALLYESDRDSATRRDINPYWHQQRLAGVELVGVQIEWADAYTRQESHKAAYELHLREAARLRCTDALLDLAEHFGDLTVFLNDELDLSDRNPADIASLAASLGRSEDAKRWLTVAAESGDAEAMRQLIEDHESGDLQECWKWLYLAQLCDIDLREDEYYAINEKGERYDDEAGGPVYVDGRGGIDLTALTPEDDSKARQAAQKLYDQLERQPSE